MNRDDGGEGSACLSDDLLGGQEMNALELCRKCFFLVIAFGSFIGFCFVRKGVRLDRVCNKFSFHYYVASSFVCHMFARLFPLLFLASTFVSPLGHVSQNLLCRW
jgi:hypothetical protein